jgi:GT2 family glycosyltransferase
MDQAQLSYCNFSLFGKSIQELSSFSFLQEEIVLAEGNNIQSNKHNFKNEKIEYIVETKNIKKYKKYVAIIPIKDNLNLLKYTIEKIKIFNVQNYIDFIIVDDRPSNNLIKEYVILENLSYVKVVNDKGFNFSILNNIAAYIAEKMGAENIVLWNSDLWPDSTETIPKLLEKHEVNNCSVTGTKLLYPQSTITKDGNSFFSLDNIREHFPNKIDNFFNTVQYGGSNFVYNNQLNVYLPIHSHRFKKSNFEFVNIDKPELFITGAFQIIKLKDFIEVGGLNPSLSKNFQDVDLCFKLLDKNKKIYYFGNNLQLIHAESISLMKENKYDLQMISDTLLFSKLHKDFYLKFIH